MMRMRETAISLLILALFLLNVSAQSLPINETFGLEVFQGNASGVLYQHECGWQDGGRLCPTGLCCSYYGWCGTTPDYCDTDKCQSQCSGPFPQGRCGWQAADGACPTGLCCSVSGWCGTTPDYCGPRDCQSQCSPPPPPPSPPPPPPPSFPQGRCGKQAAGGKCPNGVCCSVSGWCGTTRNYCGYPYCQSQCKSSLTSSPKNRMRGNESFLLNVV